MYKLNQRNYYEFRVRNEVNLIQVYTGSYFSNVCNIFWKPLTAFSLLSNLLKCTYFDEFYVKTFGRSRVESDHDA